MQAPSLATPPVTGSLQVTGRLLDRAELRHSATGGPSVLSFEMDAGKGLPFIVRQTIAADPSWLRVAEMKVTRLVPGAVVHVYAHGCLPRMDHGTAALLLLDVVDVITSKTEG